MWLRMLAIFCLVLVCFATTAQVCHVHGQLASIWKTSDSDSDSKDSRQTVPDHCSLCAAMHSALPAASHVAPDPVLQVQAILLKTVEARRVQLWHYELFSRPPPVMLSRA